MPGQSAGARLRALLSEQAIVVAPGVWDGLSARMVAEAGFAAAYCTGGGIARGHGWPDLGLVTLSELTATVSNIAEVCDLPLIVDLDSGFGNVLNIRRGVGLIEHAGAAGCTSRMWRCRVAARPPTSFRCRRCSAGYARRPMPGTTRAF